MPLCGRAVVVVVGTSFPFTPTTAAVTIEVLFFVEGRHMPVVPVAGEMTGVLAWMES